MLDSMSDNLQLGIIMDPISEIHPEKDTTLALMLAAQTRGWQLHYLEIQNLFIKYGRAFGITRYITIFPDKNPWYSLDHPNERPLDQFDILLMRKDPPVDMEYFYATQILEQVEQNGGFVANKPQSLRDANEKIAATWFPQCMPPTLVSANHSQLRQFIADQNKIVLKSLAGMGGRNVFICEEGDLNLNVILETVTQGGQKYAMAQKFIPEIFEGDKRIILIDGEPFPYALARFPKAGDFRGNISAGGIGQAVALSKRDYWICEQVGPELKKRGLYLVGIDVIGEYLTEVNVTSPTCVVELQAQCNINITDRILDCFVSKLEA